MPRSSSLRFTIFLLSLLLIVLLILILRSGRHTEQPAAPKGSHPVLSELTPKPQPKEITFGGCPPEGDGNDPALNLLKNRVDEGEYLPVPFDSIVNLSWPREIERRKRSLWSESSRRDVAQYEGIPVEVEGYLAGVKEEGPESPNCHEEGHDNHDFHVWLVKKPDDDRNTSIVVEMTPRVRAAHPEWSLGSLRGLVRRREHVRIAGWLMLDPEHPDQVGKTRGTIWEIHPVMRCETGGGGSWQPLRPPS